MPTNLKNNADLNATNARYKAKGTSGTAVAGTTTNIDMLVPVERLICGLELVLSGHAHGDSVTLQVVDVDNILPAPNTGAVVAEYATNWSIAGDKSLQGPYMSSFFATVPAGLYLRVAYTSVGGSNVSVRPNYYLVEPRA